ncbi:U32 family peptidase [Desulfovibrio sp. OttesenSCG-928-G15]|nr:U32 family peptidase [Desulfovibrio sp. OttesenSCG-928-G15]
MSTKKTSGKRGPAASRAASPKTASPKAASRKKASQKNASHNAATRKAEKKSARKPSSASAHNREKNTALAPLPEMERIFAAEPDAAHALAAVQHKPEILAPAGDMPAALAALAAGADAIYLGLKHFSARMQADNFATGELAGLVSLAHAEGRRVYVAMNTLVKPAECDQAYRLIRRLAANVHPDALIIQDPAMLDLARQAGFGGELHLSTLANVSHPRALQCAKELGANRVIVPRELSFEEMRLMDAACPDDLALEAFVHGALCYCVSGRCWWSSYMGGKSGLRGRCVQPCRRQYTQKGREERFFSCMDLSLDTAAKALLSLPHMRSWKIEGRKKGPHYVYYVTSAYRMLRDEGASPEAAKEARNLLSLALGRPGTRARFMDGGADASPTQSGKEAQAKDFRSASGLLCARVGKAADGAGCAIRPRIALLAKDLLRIGYEDEAWHQTLPVTRNVDKEEEFSLRVPGSKRPKPGTPVFLIDRREKELMDLLREWGEDLKQHTRSLPERKDVSGQSARKPVAHSIRKAGKITDIRLLSSLPHGKKGKEGIEPNFMQGLWLSPKALKEISRTLYSRISWWLPPVIWPDEEAAWIRLIHGALRGGAKRFVLNAPWQSALFAASTLFTNSPKGKTGGRAHARPAVQHSARSSEPHHGVHLTAGPFCNLANACSLRVMQSLGFEAAIISPELGEEDILALPAQSPLPLGIVLDGYWPVGIARYKPASIKSQEPFQSPKGEQFWVRRYGANFWYYPAWPLNLGQYRAKLEASGYTSFVHMDEHPPQTLTQAERPGDFNWKVDVL